MDPQIQARIDLWLKGDYDASTKAAVRRLLEEHPKEAVDAFYKNLEFGTGGLRAIMGVGSNRLNQYTVQMATQGLANYLLKEPKQHAVFIGYDSRLHSRDFAEETAKVLAANGIKAYLVQDICPTPVVSFGCRYKKCSAAVMITASHNPPEYNGYKVFWSDGAQVIHPHDQGIIDEMHKVHHLNQIHKSKTLEHHLIEEIDDEIKRAYMEAIYPLQLYPEQNHQHGSRLKIVYTSLHGTGIAIIPKVLESWGFVHIDYVGSQVIPDGSFPTLKSPNPEDPKALALGLKVLEDKDADLLIATDPDADRMGVALRINQQNILINGNQIACICLHQICKALTEQKRMPSRPACVKTIATTELFRKIAESFQIACFDTMTGFKYIAELIRQWEAMEEGYNFVFGGEESFGYLYGTQARDKDAVLASALICEIALEAKLKGKTLLDLLYEIYQVYGVYHERLLSLTFEETKQGREQLEEGMRKFKHSPPKSLDGTEVISVVESDSCIKLQLADGSTLLMRASGTEPKIKVYCSVCSENPHVPRALEQAQQQTQRLLNSIQEYLAKG